MLATYPSKHMDKAFVGNLSVTKTGYRGEEADIKRDAGKN